ncbi:hypothetical protein [Arenimonas sp.]|uniref:hypothetical protein n=1 Tax=Arenimonas sp. TaxID=1872635 RepID=UPI0039E5F317
MRALFLALAATVCLAGCQSPPVKVLKVDNAHLREPGRVPPANACGYRLKSVVDGRAQSDAGGLGLKQLKIDDAIGLVRDTLLEAGMLPADAQSNGREVTVVLRQLYLSWNRMTKVPVVVYTVQVPGQEDFLIRAQPATINWAATDDETYRSISRALHGANAQLLDRLAATCRP